MTTTRATMLRRLALVYGLTIGSLILAGCGGSGSSDDEITVRLEITSSGPSIAWSGQAVTAKGTIIPLSGTTPFTQDFNGQAKGSCNLPCTLADLKPNGFEASIQKSAPSNDVLTVCLTDRADSTIRQCATTAGTAPASVGIDF